MVQPVKKSMNALILPKMTVTLKQFVQTIHLAVTLVHVMMVMLAMVILAETDAPKLMNVHLDSTTVTNSLTVSTMLEALSASAWKDLNLF